MVYVLKVFPFLHFLCFAISLIWHCVSNWYKLDLVINDNVIHIFCKHNNYFHVDYTRIVENSNAIMKRKYREQRVHENKNQMLTLYGKRS